MALSRSEEIRIFRALYRYETYHHLFGRNTGRREGVIPVKEINHILFGLFEPWEAEAMASIEVFVRRKYECLFDQVKDELHATNSRFMREDGEITDHDCQRFGSACGIPAVATPESPVR